MRAIGASACEICTAPIITSRTAGTSTVRNQASPSCSIVWLLPARSAASSASASGSPATSAAATKRCAPSASRVDQHGGAPLAPRRIQRLQVFEPHALDPLDIDANAAAAGKADPPGRLVGDAEFQHFGRAGSRSRRSASSTTAPSTQPPETEPRKRPSASIARCEPTGRGAEPQVSTTVATATPRPSRRHCSAAASTSSSLASMA